VCPRRAREPSPYLGGDDLRGERGPTAAKLVGLFPPNLRRRASTLELAPQRGDPRASTSGCGVERPDGLAIERKCRLPARGVVESCARVVRARVRARTGRRAECGVRELPAGGRASRPKCVPHSERMRSIVCSDSSVATTRRTSCSEIRTFPWRVGRARSSLAGLRVCDTVRRCLADTTVSSRCQADATDPSTPSSSATERCMKPSIRPTRRLNVSCPSCIHSLWPAPSSR
jgi:hypothetical protein